MFKGMYFDGKKIVGTGRRRVEHDYLLMEDVCVVELYLDGEERPFLWVSHKHERPTSEVPRKYREYINYQLLEDIHDER